MEQDLFISKHNTLRTQQRSAEDEVRLIFVTGNSALNALKDDQVSSGILKPAFPRASAASIKRDGTHIPTKPMVPAREAAWQPHATDYRPKRYSKEQIHANRMRVIKVAAGFVVGLAATMASLGITKETSATAAPAEATTTTLFDIPTTTSTTMSPTTTTIETPPTTIRTTTTTVRSSPHKERVISQAVAVTSTSDGIWDRLAHCESSGNWAINTGNGYYGGLQFTLDSWEMVGGTGYPHQASREEQISRAEALQEIQGWGAWPACSSKLGLR